MRKDHLKCRKKLTWTNADNVDHVFLVFVCDVADLDIVVMNSRNILRIWFVHHGGHRIVEDVQFVLMFGSVKVRIFWLYFCLEKDTFHW